MTNREIDKEIAEKVMGWTKKLLYKDFSVWFDKDDNIVMHSSDLPEYSTDISDAWLVVEKMVENYLFEMTFDLNSCWCSFTSIDKPREIGGSYDNKSAPMAICKAALKAMEVK